MLRAAVAYFSTFDGLSELVSVESSRGAKAMDFNRPVALDCAGSVKR